MKLKLSDDLTNFRADRPSEWKMDEYIAKAIELEGRVAELEASAEMDYAMIAGDNALVAGLKIELAALKAGQGEPVAWLFCMGDKAQEALLPHEVDPEVFAENPQYYTKLYTQGCATSCLQAPTIPEGWQLVPIVPTQQQIDSGWEVDWSVLAIYKAMLSAAPKP